MSTATSPSDVVPQAPAVQGSAAAGASAKPKSKGRALLFVLLFVAVLGGGGYGWTHRTLESTDNAQVDGEVIAVPARTGGTIAQVLFTENQAVKAGDTLAVLDDESAKAKLAQAEANVEAAEAAAEAAEADARVAEINALGNKSVAEASLQTAQGGVVSAADQRKEAEASVKSAETAFKQAEADLNRNRKLLEQGALPQASFEKEETSFAVAQANLEAAKARLATLRANIAVAQSRTTEASAKLKQSSNVDALVAQAHARAKTARAQVAIAKATRDLAKLELSYTRIVAPADGVASKKTIAVGQQVAAGQAIVQLVTPLLWVTANFKETQVAKMHAGQPARMVVDALPGVTLHGELESLSGATGSRFTLLPPDNASGNYTKVVQRVPVRVKLRDVPQGLVLRPGMSVELSIDTRG
ncbi:HlyD family secretion protein [Polyangium jinanense]|uniref:HlyD family secretion protein n=1 Tax=Polyangium jinanense TaxID=2829994 RepID=A0A9X3X5Y7_9BACT|nr:HlyD family secretion protein [Polyangium jinanense]MDC3953983.1 HlyD family secretion protein [Polyangium jinanense]MDC3957804.1 HlyD family secretion protein [Polyangium jinanense]MDC3978890.1 HlyD family secretion protein [Polyangium jinanense]MDC3982061.1 HlyD family secretion protein [Polyangium jinanense]